MNYLQLCQRTAQECGVATGSAITTALPTVTGATGSLARIVNWVNEAWGDIQMDHDDWDWMRSSNILGGGVSFPTIAGQYSYPLGLNPSGFSSDFSSDFSGGGTGAVGVAEDSFGKWDRETFRCQTTSVGYADEMFLDEIPFDAWRNAYMLGAMRSTQTRPVVIAVGPDQSLNVGPPPNGNYTITADYFVAPSDMTVDADVPTGLPARFHLLIVYRAMIKYGGYEAAPEVTQRGREESSTTSAQLQAVRAPRLVFGGALA